MNKYRQIELTLPILRNLDLRTVRYDRHYIAVDNWDGGTWYYERESLVWDFLVGLLPKQAV